jgi:hypothetical protein
VDRAQYRSCPRLFDAETVATRPETSTQEDTMKLFRQGDVLLTRVAKTSRPRQLTPATPSEGRWILARGEATGHHHGVPADVATLGHDEGGVMWLTVDQPTEVAHQEHAPITLDPGTYRVTIQREWTDNDEPRQVLD